MELHPFIDQRSNICYQGCSQQAGMWDLAQSSMYRQVRAVLNRSRYPLNEDVERLERQKIAVTKSSDFDAVEA